MKTTCKYIMCGVLALSMVGCKGFFESESPSAMDAQTVYSNPQLTEQTIAGVYDMFGNDKGYRNRLSCGYMGLNTDIEHGTKNSGKADYYIYTMTPVSSDLSTANGKDPWGYMNIMIERCNNIIEGIEQYADTVTDEKMRYFLGEAYFLRSFVYLDMVKLWGDVPPRFASLAKDPNGVNTKKDNRNIVFEHLRGDLRRATELLPWSSECPGVAASQVGRPSKAAALALLMRSDMMYAGKGVRPDTYTTGPVFNLDDASARKALYEEVLWAAAQIMNGPNESKKLLPNYEDIFKNICQDEMDYYKSEVIWAIPFASTRGQVLQYNCPKGNEALLGLKNNKSGSTNSAVAAVPTLYYDFEEGDTRRDVTMLPYYWVYDNGSKFDSDADKRQNAFGTYEGKILYQKNQAHGDWYMAKYRIEWMKRERDNNDDGIDFSVIRYADVLLMAAEATIGGIGNDVPSQLYAVDGQKCFDQVRERAGVAAKPLTMEAIQEERKLEFAGEYIRKFDLMRWGILKDAMIKANERLIAMDAHTGEFASLGDTIYFKYKNIGYSDEYSYSEAIDHVYVLDSVWGLKKGETGPAPTYNKANGWVKKSIYADSSKGRKLAPANYQLYDLENPDCLNSRQYWPIFSVNVGSSNGTLWNDYGYGE